MQSRFFDIANKFRKLHFQTHLKEISHVEYIMLGAIYFGPVVDCKEQGIEGFEKLEARMQEQNECLQEKRRTEGVRISQLTKLLKGSKSATSKTLHNLEKKGYIERKIDTKDKRNIYVKLTKEGEKILLDARNRMEKFSERVIERMGVSDSEHLLRLMRKLYIIMEEEMSHVEEKE